MNRALVLLVAACASSLAPATDARRADETAAAPRPVDFESFTVFTESDLYTLGTESDRYCTIGQKFTWISDRLDKFVAAFESARTNFYPERATKNARAKDDAEKKKAAALQLRAAVSFGQNMFTPADLRATTLQPDDRPYAAWIYLSAALQARSVSAPGSRRDWLTVWGADAGLVGPAALGKPIQDFVHDRNLAQPARPPLAPPVAQRTRPQPLPPDQTPPSRRPPPRLRRRRHRPRRLLARQRRHLRQPRRRRPPRLRPARQFRRRYHPLRRRHLAGRRQPRAVGRDISLDGNMFTASHHVAREVFAGDFQFGLAVTLARWTLCLSQVRLTPELKLQGHAQAYGSITLTFPISAIRKLTR
jgi:hypothetical protein